jgi:hypothetical protein
LSVLDYGAARRWSEQLVLERPSVTVQNYLWGLQVFCDWVKKNPDELIIERLREISEESDYSKTQTFRRIADYQLRDRSKTKHSKAMILKALASFYENNSARIGEYGYWEGKRAQLREPKHQQKEEEEEAAVVAVLGK